MILPNKISDIQPEKSDYLISVNMSLASTPPMVSLPRYEGFMQFAIWQEPQAVSKSEYRHKSSFSYIFNEIFCSTPMIYSINSNVFNQIR